MMRSQSRFVWSNVLCLAVFISARAYSADPTVGKYDVLELTYAYSTAGLTNPWEQVSVVAVVTTPSGTKLQLDGFFYDTDTYKVRISPAEVGTYAYQVTINGPSGTQTASGGFTAVASAHKGFLRRLSGSPYKLVYQDGSFFFGIGFNDCWGDIINGSLAGFIGDPNYEPAGEGGEVDINTYFQKYAQDGGFNWLRWNPGNCSFDIKQSLSTSGNFYQVAEGKLGDQLLATARAKGFEIMFTLFHGDALFADAATNPAEADALERYIRYAVARYGAYVSLWEMTNETGEPSNPINPWEIPDSWLTLTTGFLRSIDPYQRLITNSNPRSTDANYLDVSSPHLYGQTWDFFDLTNKTLGLPEVPGEIGRVPGGSGPAAYNQSEIAKMRLADWTGFLGGAGLMYWNSSFSTTCCNQYMGSAERAQNKVLSGFVQGLDASFQASRLWPQGTCAAGVSFTASNSAGAYIYCGQSMLGNLVSGAATFSLNVPFAGTASWISPATGKTLQTFSVNPGTQSFTTPVYTEDIALKIVSSAQANFVSPAAPKGFRKR